MTSSSHYPAAFNLLPNIWSESSGDREASSFSWFDWVFPLIRPWAATCTEASSLQIPDVPRPLWCMHRWKPRRIFSNNQAEGKYTALWLTVYQALMSELTTNKQMNKDELCSANNSQSKPTFSEETPVRTGVWNLWYSWPCTFEPITVWGVHSE